MEIPKKGILMAYVGRSCDLPKRDIFNGLHKHFRGAFFKITKIRNLMDYINRSYDP